MIMYDGGGDSNDSPEPSEPDVGEEDDWDDGAASEQGNLPDDE